MSSPLVTLVRSSLWIALIVVSHWAGRPAQGSDWPAWRGPNHDGLSPETGGFTGQPQTAWTFDLGAGYSPATVVGDRVYGAGWADGKDTIHCLSASDGSKWWSYSYPAARHRKSHQGGPVAQVIVHNGSAWLVDRVGTLRCVDADNGQLKYEVDLAGHLGVKPPTWMFSGSPVLEDGVMYIDLGRIAALDPADGRILWQSDNFGPSYATPTPFEFRGRKLLACFPKSGLVIVDRRHGDVIARYPWKTAHGVHAAAPVVLGDRIFISSGYNTGCAMLKFTGNDLQLLWQNKHMRNHMATCVAIGDFIYGIDERQLACIAVADGSTQWTERRIGKGALTAADGKLIVQADRGDLVIVEAKAERYNELARYDAVGGRNQWTMPVPANGKVYCRSADGPLACIVFK